MKAWTKRLAALEERPGSAAPEPEIPDLPDVAPFVEMLEWLGLREIPVTAKNWRTVLRALSDDQFWHFHTIVESLKNRSGEVVMLELPPPPEPDLDIEIQTALLRAGFFRNFERIGFCTLGRTNETLGRIDLAKLTDAELAVLEREDLE